MLGELRLVALVCNCGGRGACRRVHNRICPAAQHHSASLLDQVLCRDVNNRPEDFKQVLESMCRIACDDVIMSVLGKNRRHSGGQRQAPVPDQTLNVGRESADRNGIKSDALKGDLA